MVGRLGAVQAQDYGGAKWAVAQRAQGLTSASIDDALADGSILRTHVLRPTWHLVTPTDIGWMLRLTAPRVKALAAYGNRESGLDQATISRSNRALAKALRGGRQLTRVELREVLRRAGIEPSDQVGMGRLMLGAELDGVVCSGALRGKQHTYALLEERIAPSAITGRAAALAELAGRYFTSHGPATVRDFAWWSGLSVTDATAGVDAAQPRLEVIEAAGGTYWRAPHVSRPAPRRSAPTAQLLPNFDEYTVGYADRSLLIDASDVERLGPRPDVIANNVIVVDGRVVGTWKRSAQRTGTPVSASLFRPLAAQADAAVAAAAERYEAFLTPARPTPAFGLAVAPHGHGVYFVDDATNTLDLLH